MVVLCYLHAKVFFKCIKLRSAAVTCPYFICRITASYHTANNTARHIASANEPNGTYFCLFTHNSVLPFYFFLLLRPLPYVRAPNISVPMRTMVEPCSMAASKSLLIPTDSVSILGSCCCRTSNTC